MGRKKSKRAHAGRVGAGRREGETSARDHTQRCGFHDARCPFCIMKGDDVALPHFLSSRKTALRIMEAVP
jgi:hypothetical protein